MHYALRLCETTLFASVLNRHIARWTFTLFLVLFLGMSRPTIKGNWDILFINNNNNDNNNTNLFLVIYLFTY